MQAAAKSFQTIDPLLNAPTAAALVPMSVTSFYRRVADGTFPRPVKLGGLSRWPKSEILAAIEALKGKRHE